MYAVTFTKDLLKSFQSPVCLHATQVWPGRIQSTVDQF